MPDLKAYKVNTDEGDGGTVIVFATNNAEARRKGADKLEIEWEDVESCRRAHYDEYAPGPVPPTVLIEDGWWFECMNCQRRIQEDAGDDDEHEFVMDPVDSGEDIFCCPNCCGEFFAKQRLRRAAETSLIELVELKFPGAFVTRCHVYEKLEPSVPGQGILASAHFMFPGSKYGAQFVFGDPEVWVSPVEVDQFKALYCAAKVQP